MKRIACLILICLGGSLSQAQGVVTDLFECNIKLVDLETKESAESTGDVTGIRMVSSNQSPDYELTTGSTNLRLTLSGKRALYSVGLKLDYSFAVRFSQNGVEARQGICHNVSVMICPQDGKLCTGDAQMCLNPPNPFDPKYGWSETSVTEGIPAFNERLLRPIERVLPISPEYPNGAKLTASCKLKGTFY